MAWLALVPLLLVLYGQSAWRGALLGLTAGVIFFSGTLYWVTNVMAMYGGILHARRDGDQRAAGAVPGELFRHLRRSDRVSQRRASV